jgi:hypothetical protein
MTANKTYFVNNCSLTFDEVKNDFFEIECDPPLTFYTKYPTPGVPGSANVEKSSLCAVCVCPIGDGLVRTVIHKAERLQGESGISYGSGVALILDGCTSLTQAMETFGYRRVEKPQDNPIDMSASNHCWEVWPEGASRWILTHDRELAEETYKRSPSSVIQYVQEPVDFTRNSLEKRSSRNEEDFDG